ncbi:hypothetical protein M413DRAFT_442053 [Hebeloma cylindrosporum]|uniref:General stress protein FMN-binding split barrel domain-containing protein n=1 Tax=Hebeloma cylindrosporum TaxID=76867 RepID=A0A0C2Y694_HEBCY|nr:hypothetical protein M413DRAFT_442053 [Hebeloma cylindrosporum h7]
MLTTRSADGQMHSRAMNPVAPDSETQLTLTFIANNVCHKFEEIQNDSHVNVSFLDPSTTNWASFSGHAKIINDREEIKKHWSSTVSLIQVVPNEIRYWKTNKGKIGRALEVGIDALTGRTASPGELRTITQEDIALTQSLHTK